MCNCVGVALFYALLERTQRLAARGQGDGTQGSAVGERELCFLNVDVGEVVEVNDMFSAYTHEVGKGEIRGDNLNIVETGK